MRPFRLSLLLLLILPPLAWPASGVVDEFDLISDYVGKIENFFEGEWTYTYVLEDRLSGETRTIRRDLSKPFPDDEELLAVDGVPPSDEQLTAYREDRQSAHRRAQRRAEREALRAQDRPDRTYQQRFLDMLNRDSIRPLKREGDLLYIEFTAMEEGRKHIFEHLVGTLIIDTRHQYIRELQVSNTRDFAPFFLSRVEEVYLSLRFALHDDVPRLAEATWQLSGHAFFIRSLDMDEEVVWTRVESVQAPN